MNLGGTNICERGNCVAIQRAQCELVEVDETEPAAPRACERCSGMRANAATSDDDDEGFAELGEAGIREEDAVPG